MQAKYLFIHQSKPPLWRVILAAALLTIALYCLYRCFNDFFQLGYIQIFHFFFSVICLVIGFPIALTNNFHLDIENDRFKEEYALGLIKIGWWEPMFDWAYVSVFKKDEGMFLIRLWIEDSDFFTVSGYDKIEMALEQGIHIGKALNIDVLDAATDPRDSVWIEMV